MAVRGLSGLSVQAANCARIAVLPSLLPMLASYACLLCSDACSRIFFEEKKLHINLRSGDAVCGAQPTLL